LRGQFGKMAPICLLAVLMLVMASGYGLAATKARPLQTVRMQLVQVTRREGKPVQAVPINVYARSGRLRIEQGSMVLLYDGQRLFSLNSASEQKVATELPVDSLGLRGAVTPTDMLQRLLLMGGDTKLLGDGTINGRPCHLLELSDVKSGSKGKAWIDKETGIPLRVESAVPPTTVSVAAQAITLNPRLQGGLFTLPAGYAVSKPGPKAG
jgi:outer membrane lipoprotein-sorting protein